MRLVLDDLTSLYFETEHEDSLRRVGMSKERRVDPQITVGLLVAPDGYPSQVAMFEGNKAETTTIRPVITGFTAEHQTGVLVLVADAGKLSAKNPDGLEDAGHWFILGSRQPKVPHDLGGYVHAHGDVVADRTNIGTTRPRGTGSTRRDRRVVYQYSFARRQRENRTINSYVATAEQAATGPGQWPRTGSSPWPVTPTGRKSTSTGTSSRRPGSA